MFYRCSRLWWKKRIDGKKKKELMIDRELNHKTFLKVAWSCDFFKRIIFIENVSRHRNIEGVHHFVEVFFPFWTRNVCNRLWNWKIWSGLSIIVLKSLSNDTWANRRLKSSWCLDWIAPVSVSTDLLILLSKSLLKF